MIHKLSAQDFDEPEYSLFAIHSALEDYHLAYCINRELSLKLRKNPEALLISARAGEATFSRFTFYNEKQDTGWDLIQNKQELATAGIGDGFFSGMAMSSTAYLLPEFSKVDYFLKIENPNGGIPSLTQKLKKIDRVSAAYVVERTRIKSKNHLIF